MSNIKPIAMTLGEPGGIGPELALKGVAVAQRPCTSSIFHSQSQDNHGSNHRKSWAAGKTKVINEVSQTGKFFEDALPVLKSPAQRKISNMERHPAKPHLLS